MPISIDNHNRRQEEEECWTKHQSMTTYDRKPTRRSYASDQEHSREYWGQQKEFQRKQLGRQAYECSSDDSTSVEIEEHRIQTTKSKGEDEESKKNKNKKNKKKKKKSLKKKKSKH